MHRPGEAGFINTQMQLLKHFVFGILHIPERLHIYEVKALHWCVPQISVYHSMYHIELRFLQCSECPISSCMGVVCPQFKQKG